jgi:hypothetical protein
MGTKRLQSIHLSIMLEFKSDFGGKGKVSGEKYHMKISKKLTLEGGQLTQLRIRTRV